MSEFTGITFKSIILMSNEWIKVIGIVAGVFTALSLLPQLIKLIKTKKAQDLSLLYLFTLFCGICLWIWYGVLRQDVPVMLTNIVSLTLNVAILVLGVRYKNKNPEK
jgi:MtN3 and saliva related transmembrane protein